MATWTLTKFDSFAKDVRDGMNLATDSFEFTLHSSVPDVTDSVWADVSATELADGNGYSGQAVSVVSAQSSGDYTLTTDAAVQLTAAGGNIGPTQHCVIRNTTIAGNPLCFFGTRAAALTIEDGSPAATLIPSGSVLYSAT